MNIFIYTFLGVILATQLLSAFFAYKVAQMRVHPTFTFMLFAVSFLFWGTQTFLRIFLRGTIGHMYVLYNGNILLTSWIWGGLASIVAFIAITRFYFDSRVLYDR